jgi:uncharacterized protein YndB with AHSA1/START domain
VTIRTKKRNNMEQRTKVAAEQGKHDIIITREFDLPAGLVFRAHTDPAIIEQWMSNPYAAAKVLKLDARKHGSYSFQSTDGQGNVVFRSNGVFHEVIADKRIVRTFEMDGAPFGVQLEVYDFEPVGDGKSRLTMHVIYESVAQRDQLLQMPFAQGINMAHDRIQDILTSQQ